MNLEFPGSASPAPPLSEEEKRRQELLMERLLPPEKQTRPILDAFFHAKFMIETAARYAATPEPIRMMPSGYAALLCLCDLR